MEQGEPSVTEMVTTAADFPAKKPARQLDFTAMCRASTNVILPEHPQAQLQSKLLALAQKYRQPQPGVEPTQLEPQQRPKQPSPTPTGPPAVQPQSRRTLLPRPTFQVVKTESPKSRQRCSVEARDDTPKKQKQCNCRNSRCLKLYCECFASGNHCSGCNCTNCHNNVEHEAARQEAVEALLERNPNAFRPKIANNPHESVDGKEEAGEVKMLVKHNKGCNCKKSGCLKKYCECFQANIMCSGICKCIDCKNFDGSEERSVLIHGEQCNIMPSIQQAANPAFDGAVWSSGFGSSPATKKQQPIFGSTSDDQFANRIAQFQQEIHLTASATCSSLLSVPLFGTTVATAGSSKFTYRSPLADILQPRDVKELCSLLVIDSTEAAMMLADKKHLMDKKAEIDQLEGSVASSTLESEDSQKESPEQNFLFDYPHSLEIDQLEGSVASSTLESEDSQKESSVQDQLSGNQTDGVQGDDCASVGADFQNGSAVSPGTRALMCDEQDTMFLRAGHPTGMAGCSQNTTLSSSFMQGFTEVYAEQERLVLMRFLNFLNRLVTCGSIKETASSPLTKPETEANKNLCRMAS